jgi:hypothetical protein
MKYLRGIIPLLKGLIILSFVILIFFTPIESNALVLTFGWDTVQPECIYVRIYHSKYSGEYVFGDYLVEVTSPQEQVSIDITFSKYYYIATCVGIIDDNEIESDPSNELSYFYYPDMPTYIALVAN